MYLRIYSGFYSDIKHLLVPKDFRKATIFADFHIKGQQIWEKYVRDDKFSSAL